MSTLREKLYTALHHVEYAKADLHSAQMRYEQVRERFNEIIDTLAPVDQPNGVLSDAQRQDVLNRSKIALIKLVRTATLEYAKTITTDAGCMGLKDAKDLVEQWLEGRMP